MTPKASDLCPASALVKNKVLYSADVCTDENGKAFTRMIEHHVRTVQMRSDGTGGKKLTAFVWQKINGVTWGKKSSKTGDYGWLSDADPFYRKKLVAGESMPSGIRTTKLAAWNYCLKSLQNRLKRANEWGNDDEEYKQEILAEITLVERRIAAERKTRSAKAVGSKAQQKSSRS